MTDAERDLLAYPAELLRRFVYLNAAPCDPARTREEAELYLQRLNIHGYKIKVCSGKHPFGKCVDSDHREIP